MNRAPAAIAGNTRWRFFSLLFAMAFLSYALRQDIQVAGEHMMPSLGLDAVQMGWIYSAFVWGYALFQLPGGLLGERYGARRLLTVLGVLWLASSMLTGILPGLVAGSTAAVIAVLLAIRFAVGAVHAPIFPVQAHAIAAWFPVGHWGLPNALSSSGLNVGAALTQPLVVWVMVHYGWQSAFFLYIPLGVIVFSLWWWSARDKPSQHRGVGAAELALIEQGRAEMHSAAEEEKDAWLRLLRNRDTLLLAAAYFSMHVVFYLFFTWFFHYLVKERGFTILQTGWWAMMPWGIAAVTAAAGGWSVDKLCRRLGPRWGCRVPGACGLFAAAIFLAAGLEVADRNLAVVLLALSFASTQFTEAAFWEAQTFIAPAHTASGTGIMNTGANLAGTIVGPVVPLLALSIGWTYAFMIASGFALLGALLWLNVRADCPLPERAA